RAGEIGCGVLGVGCWVWGAGNTRLVINIEENRRRIQMLSSYRDWLVWQKAMELVVETYRLSSRFPKEEQYGLTSQLRRASVSVPSNIAEGYGRASRKEYLQFLYVGQGSLKERKLRSS